MPTGRLAPAQHLLTEALDTLDHAAGPAAGDTEMLSVLTSAKTPHAGST
jgi:hypothetical protein